MSVEPRMTVINPILYIFSQRKLNLNNCLQSLIQHSAIEPYIIRKGKVICFTCTVVHFSVTRGSVKGVYRRQ